MNRARIAVTLLFLLLPIAVQATAAEAPDTAFLRSLGSPGAAPSDPLNGLGTPTPSPRSCSVSRDCGDGNTVSCTGSGSCAYSQKSVTCDGTEVACPNYCTMGWTCESCPGYTYFCWSLRGDCGVTGEACDGRPQRCLCPLHPQP
jgi:hypothetical protein